MLKKFVCLFAFLLLFSFINSQIDNWKLLEQYPSNCSSSQYFDTVSLQCKLCPVYTNTWSFDPYNCRCNQTSFYSRNNGGANVNCTPCRSNQVQSSDGWGCVLLNQTCGEFGFLTDTDIDGSLFLINNNTTRTAKCIECDPSTTTTSSGCISCYPFVFSDSPFNFTSNFCSKECKVSQISSSGICLFNISSKALLDTSIQIGSVNQKSWFLETYSEAAYYQCRTATNRNSTACQLLFNMCTLIYFYKSNTRFQTVCDAYSDIPPSQDLPTLDSKFNGIASYESMSVNQVELKLTYDNSKSTCQTNSLSFVAAKYRLNGKLISYSTFDLTELEICNLFDTGKTRISDKTFIAVNYKKTCKIRIDKLIQIASNEPIFYELYLRYQSENGTFYLLPVPVVVNNNPILNQRFFIIDQYSTKGTQSGPVQYIRYASSIDIQLKLFNDQSDMGRIYPPILYINYDFISATSDLMATVSPSFSVNYNMVLDTQISNIWISIAVLASLAFIWSIIRTWGWNKRSGKMSSDIVTVFKFLMYLSSSVGDVFFVVFVGVCIWWLIVFKGQTFAYILVPQVSQESVFSLLLIVGFALKTLDVIHLIFVQVSYDIFVVDWEKPKVEKGSKSSISCWRSIFVVNEWNEIQTIRKTNLTFQLAFTLLLLKVVNLEALCSADCNTSLNPDESVYKAEYSNILRTGMAGLIYVSLGIFQWLAYKVIYSRCIEDKIGQFVDFCSVSNVSMFIFTNAKYGYYIHGKSPNGNADASMKEMIFGFEKESYGLVGKRGLAPDRDSQVFAISITNKLRKQYINFMLPIYQRRPKVRMNHNVDDINNNEETTKITSAYEQLNRFFQSYINQSLRDYGYLITKRKYIENLFDFEFNDPYETGFFYEADGPIFEKAIFAGRERTLFIFDAILFLFVDYYSNNFVLASFVVYVVSKIINKLRNDLGKINISRKTLVDKRFLI